MDVARNLELLRSSGPALADVAAGAGLDASVPSCPGWRVVDLLRHVGMVHRWAADVVRDARSEPPEEQPAPADDELDSWVREGHAALVAVLDDAPADLSCWTFLASPSPRAFWCRRQSHETAIHRVDAGLALGETVAFEADLAADGLDELLVGFLPRPHGRLRTETERTVVVHATDVDQHWLITLRPGTPATLAGPGPGPAADCVVAGAASDLYLTLWNRRDRSGLTVEGDVGLLDHWESAMHVRWA